MNTAAHKPFPWFCHECRQRTVQAAEIEHVAESKYDGALHTFRVPHLSVARCATCGEVQFTATTESQISRALRDHLHLLQPQHIRKNREHLGLSQQQLASAIGCAAETLSRWECGVIIQSRGYDKALRAYFGAPSTRLFLSALLVDPTLGAEVVDHLQWNRGAWVVLDPTSMTSAPSASTPGIAHQFSFGPTVYEPQSQLATHSDCATSLASPLSHTKNPSRAVLISEPLSYQQIPVVESTSDWPHGQAA